MSAVPKLNPEPVIEAPARPKVLRRPPHLVPKTPKPTLLPAATLVLTETALEEPADDAAPALTKTWHDDRRFTFILLAIVILLNVAMVAWLSAIPKPQRDAADPAYSSTFDQEKRVHLLDTLAPTEH